MGRRALELASIWEARDRAALGDLQPLESVLAAPADDETARAGVLALRAVRWIAAPERGERPSLEELARFVSASGPARRVAADAVVHLSTVAILDADPDGMSACERLHEQLEPSEAGALWRRRLRSWRALMAGEDVVDRATALGRDAAKAGLAAMTIEGTALAALAHADADRADEATSAARRVSRMARSEGLVAHEYLANIVLARVRRVTGKSHLAARILVALADVVPRSFFGWLDWELGFAGVATETPRIALPNGARALLPRMMAAAAAGKRAELNAVVGAVHAAAGPWVARRRDVDAVALALDPAKTAVSDWCSGREHRTLGPLQSAWGADPTAAPAYVACGLRPPRRILRAGIGLLDADEPVVLDRAQRRDARVLLLLAVLALRAEQGGRDEDVFREVYGFSFVRSKHEGVLRVLIHRARAHLGEHGAIERGDGTLKLVARGAALVPDPRCASTLEERVMSHLGNTAAAMSAKEVAEALGVSVRAAQRALKQLASEGACVSEKRDRGAAYRLEDTTFLEPTRSRVSPDLGPTRL